MLVLVVILREVQWIESATGTAVARWVRGRGKAPCSKRGDTEVCGGVAEIGWRRRWI